MYSASVAEKTVFLNLGGLRDSSSVNKSEYSSVEVLRGDSIKLRAVLEDDDLTNINYHYLWQMSTDAEHWNVVNPYSLEDNEYEEISIEEGVKYYRVLVLTDYALYFQYENIEDCEDCKISSIIKVVTKSLDLTYEILNPKPCFATEPLKLRLSLRNPLSKNIENVKINLVEFSQEPCHFSALNNENAFNDSLKQWNVGTLLAGETKTIDIGITSPLIHLSLGVFLYSADDLCWKKYEYATTQLYIDEAYREVSISIPTIEFCGSSQSNLVNLASFYGIRDNNVKFYEDEDRQKEVFSIDTSIPTSDKGKKYYAVAIDDSGCESKMIDFDIIVKKFPKLVMAEPEDSILCNIGEKVADKVTIKYKIEGGVPPYIIDYTFCDISKPDFCGSNFVNVQSAEGSFEEYPYMPSEYKITSILSGDGCWSEQEVKPFRIYIPRSEIYSTSNPLEYKLKGGEYKVSCDDAIGEFDTYQWQVSYDNGNIFEDLIDTENPEVDAENVVSGAQTSSLTISNLSETPETARYRVKLSNSSAPCIVNYSTTSVVRIYSDSNLSLNIFSDDLSKEYVCENEKVELRCQVFNGDPEDYNDLKIKLDISESVAELVVIPSVGTYDYETKIWHIDKLVIGNTEDIVVSFNATKDATIRLDCEGKSVSASFKVLGKPVIGTLQTPDPACEGTSLYAQVPEIQAEVGVTDVKWYLDGDLTFMGATLIKEKNGSLLKCEVANNCGSTMSNEVVLKIAGPPVIREINENIYSICEGDTLSLSTPIVEAYGNTDIKERWVLNGETYIPGTPIYKNGDKPYELYYEVEGECGGVRRSVWGYTFIVHEGIKLGKLQTPDPICNNSYLYPPTPAISFNGTEFISERWVLDGETYEYEELSYDKSGKKLYYEVTQSCNGKLSDVRSNEVEITVLPPVEILDIPEIYEYKEGKSLELTNPTVEYGIEPNEYIKYDAKWSLLDEEESVVVEDYNGQPIYNDDIIKKIRYEINSMIYFSPGNYSHCELVYSKTAKLIPEVATALDVVMADEDETVWATAITPYNNNGLNDTFAEGMHVKVFDSRLQQIFEGDNGWDGTANMGSRGVGAIQPPGVYYYCVITSSGEKKLGLIEIVRM